MPTLRVMACAALVTLMAGGCLAQEYGEITPATAGDDGASAAHRRVPETAGLASLARGDNWIAANRFERARAADDSPLNRFNLAAAYESTGRSEDAAAQYRSVVVDGRSARLTIHPRDADPKSAGSTFNLAEEARRRLAVIDFRRGQRPAPEFVVGASASPFVGGPARGPVSDARALQLDEAARTANDQ